MRHVGWSHSEILAITLLCLVIQLRSLARVSVLDLQIHNDFTLIRSQKVVESSRCSKIDL